jgi:hypothetical protein
MAFYEPTRRNRLWPVFLFCLSGCASIPDDISATLGEMRAPIELTATPFYPQNALQCGPAALTTALDASGVQVSLADIERRVFLPGRNGSLQVDMLATTRTSGRMPYLLDQSFDDIIAELYEGRPVVVLQNLGVSLIPQWHYAVVIGIEPEAGNVLLRSGVDKRRVTRIGTFLKTWQRSDNWGMVALRPGERPAQPNLDRYLAAVAGFEPLGQPDELIAAWQVAHNLWPDNPVALFGLGNAIYASGEPAKAEIWYRHALEIKSGDVLISNNLAMSLADQGRFAEALRLLDDALSAPHEDHLSDALLRTRKDIENLRDAAAEK